MRFKILITSFTFPPNKDGVSEAAFSMAKGFAQAGHQVVVCTGYLSARDDFSPIPNVRLEQFRLETTKNTARDFPGESARYREFLVSEQPDFIFCHCWEIWPTALAESVFPRLAGRKIMVSHGYTTHLWRPNARPPWGLGVLLRSLPKVLGLPATIRKYDRVIFLSETQNFDRFFDQWVAKKTGYQGCRVIPNGTDPHPARLDPEIFREQHELNGKFLVICVANFSVRKNQEAAVLAYRQARLKDSVLILIGSEFNEYSGKVQKLDDTLRKEFPEGEVRYFEKLDRLTTLGAVAASDMFLLAATAETQPISLLEAMAAGKPFLSTDTGCVREMPGGMVAGNERELVAHLQELFERNDLRTKLGGEGQRAVAEWFAAERVLEQQARLLEEFDTSERNRQNSL